MSLASKLSSLFGNSGTAFDTALVPAGSPTGSVTMFAGVTAPAGWAFCFGQAVSRTDATAALFAVLGTTFGAGDGSTTFNLPDCRGRAAVGKDDMGGTAAGRLTASGFGTAANALGAVGGAETHILTTPQLPSHAHSGTTDSAGAHTHTGGVSAGQAGSGGGTTGATSGSSTGSAGAHTHSFTTNNTGTGLGHPNVQPSLVLNTIIKL